MGCHPETYSYGRSNRNLSLALFQQLRLNFWKNKRDQIYNTYMAIVFQTI